MSDAVIIAIVGLTGFLPSDAVESVVKFYTYAKLFIEGATNGNIMANPEVRKKIGKNTTNC